ncbi:hypothetical protein [Caldimonas caldifontis]|uniref:PASTA domain-containing protein n=1 Tax=Caldimonas caldifontis TaxID=1452508 RepID=A0A2S5SQG1_9BURK|nr:hypothetical protein [Caldimonas caldifontis]PPE64988.1 hypothetical protein C1704_16510 [Caldimonas caldifontis]
MLHSIRSALGLLALATLAGCGSLPAPGSVVTVAPRGAITPQDLERRPDVRAARAALEAQGIGPAEIAAGRVLWVQCAVVTDGWWDSLAIVPAGLTLAPGRALTLTVTDPGTNDRLAVNRITALAEPPLGPGGLAYRLIPDWRERGLRNNYEEQPPQGGPRAAYLKVQGRWVVRCRMP